MMNADLGIIIADSPTEIALNIFT